jgi:xanthine dehydrogenase accessory factor
MMTMGHATDQPILVEILKTRAADFPYIGVIGSEAKAAVLRRGVLGAGVPESLLERYTCPIGLPLGTNDPAEIAVSIAAQLLQRRDHLATSSREATTPSHARVAKLNGEPSTEQPTVTHATT